MEEAENICDKLLLINKAKVTFTNRGGDITSYKLLEHKDKETGSGVEMVNNVTSSNRAFSLSFGGTENPALNDIFNVTKKDDYTILFYRDYEIKDSEGNPKKFTLGKRYTFSPDDYAFKLDVSIISKEGIQSRFHRICELKRGDLDAMITRCEKK